MENIHIHEILELIISENKIFNDQNEYEKFVIDNFGENARFFACSAQEMDAKSSFEFLMYKGKIVEEAGKIVISPTLHMCDSHRH